MSRTDDAPVNRVSLLTPAGRGAVAVVAATGPQAFSAVDAEFSAANGRALQDQAVGRIVFGDYAGEEAVVCRLSDQAVEVHCHGGRVAAQRVLDQLAAAGCQIEPWSAWLTRTGQSAIAGEAAQAIANALTRRTARILLDQHAGALARRVDSILTELAAHRMAPATAELDRLLARTGLGQRLTEPWRVVIGGLPNVGKSCLINALVGYERAIVFDLPGTTRDAVTAAAAMNGWPVQLIDVAGFRGESTDPVESAGIEIAREHITAADLLLWVVDAQRLSRPGCASINPLVHHELAAWNLPEDLSRLIVINKIDLQPQLALEQDEAVAVSALNGTGIGALTEKIAAQLVPDPPSPGVAVPFTERQRCCLAEARSAVESDDLTAAVASLRALTRGDFGGVTRP